MLIRPPKILTNIYPSFIWSFHNRKDDNGIYLTFDDGPCPQVTPWVLDQLDMYGAKATFFLIGKNVELYPELFMEIVKRGHSIGNHSYSHIKGWGTDRGIYVGDVDTAAELIPSTLYRPPYAKITPKQASEICERYNVVMWSILSRDYNRSLTGKQCVRNVVPYMAPGEVVVFHDSVKSSKNLWYALPEVLEAAKKKGLQCKSIIL